MLELFIGGAPDAGFPDVDQPTTLTLLGDTPPATTYYADGSPIIYDGSNLYVMSLTDTYKLSMMTRRWTKISGGTVQQLRYGSRVLDLVRGKAHLIWGYTTVFIQQAKLYDVATNTFATMPYPSTTTLGRHNQIVIGEIVYLFGGIPANSFNGARDMNVYYIDPDTQAVVAHGTTNPAVMMVMANSTLGYANGCIYLTGGTTRTGNNVANNMTTWRYELATKTWTQLAAPLFRAHSGTQMPFYKGKFWLLGEYDTGVSNAGNAVLYSMDPVTGTMTKEIDWFSTMSVRRAGFLFVWDDKMYRFGPLSGATPTTDLWQLPPIA